MGALTQRRQRPRVKVAVGPPVAVVAATVSEKTTKAMREHYELKGGRPNPHAAKVGRKERAALLRLWSTTANNVRLLPPDLAREFPDSKSTVAALRMVVRLRKGDSKTGQSNRTSSRRRPRRRQAG